MVIIDTTVWIDYLAGRNNPETEWLDQRLGKQPLGLTDLILCEVLQGLRGDAEFETIRRELAEFEVFTNVSVELAAASAQNCRRLRRNGHTINRLPDSDFLPRERTFTSSPGPRLQSL